MTRARARIRFFPPSSRSVSRSFLCIAPALSPAARTAALCPSRSASRPACSVARARLCSAVRAPCLPPCAVSAPRCAHVPRASAPACCCERPAAPEQRRASLLLNLSRVDKREALPSKLERRKGRCQQLWTSCVSFFRISCADSSGRCRSCREPVRRPSLVRRTTAAGNSTAMTKCGSCDSSVSTAEPPARQHPAQLRARQPALVASRLQDADADADAEAEADADVQQPPAKSVSPQTGMFTEVGRTGAMALGTTLGKSLEAAAMTHRSGAVVLGRRWRRPR